MKTKDLMDVRKKDPEQLRKMIGDKKEELRKVNLDMTLGQENNVKKARSIKKDIAQLMTIVKEKELIEEMKATTTNKDEKGEN